MKSLSTASFSASLITIFGLLLFSPNGQAQIWARIVAENNLSIEAVSAEQVPYFGTFWSIQRTNMPPLPFNPFPQLSVYYLGYGNSYLLDDSTVDYVAIYQKREEERALRQLEWEFGLLSTEEYLALEGGFDAMMQSSLASNYAYGNDVYLVDMAAAVTNDLTTASFSIVGGTNNVPYDIISSTNVAAAISDWNWIGIGYTSNRYSFANQPADQAFYRLARPSQTLTVPWGENVYGQCDFWSGISNAVQVSGGTRYSLALLSNGTVVGWGFNGATSSQLVPTNLAGVAMIASGWQHNVALLTNGTVTAWGDNFYGQLNVPAGLSNVTVISAQALHSLALTTNGTVLAWGGETNVPVGLSNVTAIAAGGLHNLAVSNGFVVAWGNNSHGQTNVPAGLSNVWDVAAGWAHSVALKRDGTVVAWGDNTHGQTNVPAGLSNVVAIAAGGYTGSGYTLALKSDGTLARWGQSAVGTALAGMSNVVAVGGGVNHGLALRTGPRTPVLTTLPTDQFQIAGGAVTFTSRGVGLYGVSYQWKTNDVNLAGATNATLTLTNVQAAQAGNYTVTISNEVGTLTSPNAALTLVTAPIILTQTPMPTNQEAIFHKNLTLSVDVSAAGVTNGFPLTYQWKFNGTNISGATTNSYNVFGGPTTLGAYSVTVTNAVGSASAGWQVTNFTYVGSYLEPGTLAHHLATNAVGRTNGFTPANMVQLSGWTWEYYYPSNLHFLTNATWSTNFWLQGVKGLSATAIGFLRPPDGPGGQGLVTMVSPRHCLFAEHMHDVTNRFVAAFLDTNNVIHWRTNVETVFIGNDLSVGILNEDLPASVDFLPVVPTNLLTYLPRNSASVVQGIGMNQHMRLFSQPLTFGFPPNVNWNPNLNVPFGLPASWSIGLGGGDSSGPERLLIGNQLVLASHNDFPTAGPNYAEYIGAINQQMHYLSTNNTPGTSYQLTIHSMTNWPVLNQ